VEALYRARKDQFLSSLKYPSAKADLDLDLIEFIKSQPDVQLPTNGIAEDEEEEPDLEEEEEELPKPTPVKAAAPVSPVKQSTGKVEPVQSPISPVARPSPVKPSAPPAPDLSDAVDDVDEEGDEGLLDGEGEGEDNDDEDLDALVAEADDLLGDHTGAQEGEEDDGEEDW